MSLTERIITIGMVVLGTMATRFLPFALFPVEKPTPEYIKYLGNVLPAAALGMLVVYCLKDVSIFSATHALPEAISLLAIAALHFWKRQMLLSIAGGTALYMLIVNFVL
ncbi:MAG: branched-chain amino acid transporter AzlD [Firmicutes bacterium]|nr:branched-chain amino acid transporter AzlD [Bacillota bacterium]